MSSNKMITEQNLLFGNSHVDLVNKIFSHLNLRIPVESNCTYFSNDEVRTKINNSVRGKNVYIVQTGYSSNSTIKGKLRTINDFIMETLLLVSTSRRSNANRIVLVMPHFPYARQDKKDSPRAAISASDICRLFYDNGVDEIISFHLHNKAIQGFTTKGFNNIPCFKKVLSLLQNIIGENKDMYTLGAPDENASQEISKYSVALGIPMVYFSKKRDYNFENVIAESRMIGDKKYVENKTVILIDDMIDTAGTMCEASNILVSKGAETVIIIATHGLFSGPAIDRLNSCSAISQIFVSDTVPQLENMSKCNKIKSFTISDTIVEIIMRMENQDSVSESSCFNI